MFNGNFRKARPSLDQQIFIVKTKTDQNGYANLNISQDNVTKMKPNFKNSLLSWYVVVERWLWNV